LCSEQHFGDFLVLFEPVVGDFYEYFSSQGFFDSFNGSRYLQVGGLG